MDPRCRIGRADHISYIFRLHLSVNNLHMRVLLFFLALLASVVCQSQWSTHPTGSDAFFRSADCVGQVVLVVGDNVVFRSTDGGTTWTFTLSIPPQSQGHGFNGVAFADANTVYCGGGEFAFKSTDAGATWTQLNTPPLVDDIWSVEAPSPNNAFFGRDGSDILRTTNGGGSFSSLYLPGSGIQTSWSICFTSNSIGFVTTGTSVYRTQNGGVTWTEVDQGLGRQAVYFPDALHGCVVGQFGTIRTTSDGGTTWVSRVSGTSNYLKAVHFFDAQHGIAVGANSIIVRTNDGGVTWFTEPPPTSDDFESVVMVSPTSVVIGSQFGTIYSNSSLALGVPKHDKPDLLAIHPNPVSDIAEITLPPEYQGALVEVAIWDQLGHQAFHKQIQSEFNELTLDLSGLMPGAYNGVVRGKNSILGHLRIMRIP